MLVDSLSSIGIEKVDAFTIFYGYFTWVLICGTLAEKISNQMGFLTDGIGIFGSKKINFLVDAIITSYGYRYGKIFRIGNV